MLDRIINFCMRQRMAVIAGTVVLVAWGLFAFQHLTIEAFPDPTDTQVQIITLYQGQPAEEIERQVSIPIERAMNGTPGLVRVRSINLFGLSYITATFDDTTDPYFARAQTTERLRLVDLPAGVQAELGSLSTPIGEVYRYTLHGEDGDALRLRTLQDWVVRPRLLQVQGVADVVSFGGLLREVHVRPDPVAMAAKQITIADLEHAIENASENASGGTIERGAEQLVIRSEGLFNRLDDIARIAVATRAGTPIYLSDVASVQVGWQPRQSASTRGADRDAVEGIVLMRKNENPTRVLEGLRQRVLDVNQHVLPPGTRIDPFYDRTELVGTTLRTVGHNMIEGAVLVILVLIVFLGSFRAALVVAVLIPLSLLCAFIFLHRRGMSANLLSLGALDFGIIVDGAVVMVEAILARLAIQGHGSTLDAIRRSITEVTRPTVFALLIIVAAYLPIMLLERVEGRLFAPLAQTVVASLLGSLVLSVTLVPALSSLAFSRRTTHKESLVLAIAARIYRPTLFAALRHPFVVAIASILALIGSARILGHLGSEFLPEINEGAVYATLTLPKNTSLAEGRRLMPFIETAIKSLPEVESHLSQLGRPEDGTDPKLSNNLEIFVRLRPADDWPAGVKSIGDVMNRMSAALAIVPGVEINLSQPIRDNVNESLAGQQGQVALKLRAVKFEELPAWAEKAKRALEGVRGMADLGIVRAGQQPQVQIRPRREMLGRFGLTMDDVQSFLGTALRGREVGELWDEEKVFPIVLRFPESARETIEQLAEVRIPTQSGALVPLETVAEIRVGEGRSAITRENGQRYIGLRMNVRGRDLGSFVDDARRAVAAVIPAGAGVEVEWGGEFESKERAMHRLQLVFPITLLVTLVLLFSVFRSFALAVLVLVNVPFALVGGAVGLAVAGLPFSISAAVGFIALVGQAALNGVLVLSAIERRRQTTATLAAAVVRGAQDRLRAVLMTAALAALGLVPAAMSRAMGAEMQRPMAVVIVGGTLSAAVLTLIVLPASYATVVSYLRRRQFDT
jgi:cobalt-zinc-cadmium resistance protein CzcA